MSPGGPGWLQRKPSMDGFLVVFLGENHGKFHENGINGINMDDFQGAILRVIDGDFNGDVLGISWEISIN